MKHLTDYKLFCEGYDEIMKNIVDDIDFNKINATNDEINKIKQKIEDKKKELEDNLSKLEKLQVDTFTADDQKLIEDKKKIIKETIDKIKLEITTLETSIKDFKDKVLSLKQK